MDPSIPRDSADQTRYNLVFWLLHVYDFLFFKVSYIIYSSTNVRQVDKTEMNLEVIICSIIILTFSIRIWQCLNGKVTWLGVTRRGKKCRDTPVKGGRRWSCIKRSDGGIKLSRDMGYCSRTRVYDTPIKNSHFHLHLFEWGNSGSVGSTPVPRPK